ncbi:hypothetical protein Nepgr_015722 [Nepenthes gracilis]|uniref:Uncharacterized protein n=1 Tax=Nepenthes gracilis TaxID=150966 RepID=A0AAD3SP03_NEPGR|nr:hypothetical protein Nepgr_015722 [Nepenthes gracilis]
MLVASFPTLISFLLASCVIPPSPLTVQPVSTSSELIALVTAFLVAPVWAKFLEPSISDASTPGESAKVVLLESTASIPFMHVEAAMVMYLGSSTLQHF